MHDLLIAGAFLIGPIIGHAVQPLMYSLQRRAEAVEEFAQNRYQYVKNHDLIYFSNRLETLEKAILPEEPKCSSILGSPLPPV